MPPLRTALTALLAAVPAAAVAAGPTTATAAPVPAASPAEVAAVAVAPEVYTVTGRVVRSATDRPVRGVRVSAYEAGETDFLGADLTDARGRFVITRVVAADNEFGIYVQGRRIGLQNGWVGCDKTVYPTFGDACTHSTPVGRIRIKVA